MKKILTPDGNQIHLEMTWLSQGGNRVSIAVNNNMNIPNLLQFESLAQADQGWGHLGLIRSWMISSS